MVIYNIFIDELCKVGCIEDVLKFFEEINGKGCVNIVMYNILFNGFCMVGCVEEVYKLFDEMKYKEIFNGDIDFDFVIYIIFLNGVW